MLTGLAGGGVAWTSARSRLADEHAALAYVRTSVVNGARSSLRRRRTARGLRLVRPVDALNSATGPSVVHAWGTARLVLADTTCTGSFGLSSYYRPVESGGSMHLLCDDGSALVATPVVTRFEPDSKQEWFIDLRLDGGTAITG